MVREFYLHNGLHVVYEPMEQVRTVSFGVWVQVGSAYETKENNGISHVIEHMLFKGTQNRTAGDIADETAALGGNLNAYTGKEYTAYYLKTLDDQLEPSMDLISDMLKASAFREEQLATEKQVVIDEISMYNDSCEDMVHEKLQKKVWKNHPLGYIISGKKRTVRAFTRQEIMDFWRTYYTAGRMLICAAGHIDEAGFQDQLERYFGDIPSGRQGNELTVPVYGVKHFRRFREIEQVHLDIAMPGLTVDAPERYAFSLANSILGGSVSSRLFHIGPLLHKSRNIRLGHPCKACQRLLRGDHPPVAKHRFCQIVHPGLGAFVAQDHLRPQLPLCLGKLCRGDALLFHLPDQRKGILHGQIQLPCIGGRIDLP